MHTPLLRSLRRGRTLLLPVVLLLPAACASAEKRLDQGMRLEQEGRPAAAADRYIDALKKDPSLADARLRLQETGARAISASLDLSSRMESGGRLDEAVTALLSAEEMRRSASAVGVGLALPPGFADRRRALLDHAVDDALNDARSLSAAARHDQADARLVRALVRYAPSPEQRDRLVQARVETGVGAARAEMAGGRYRAAYQRVERLRQALGGAPGQAQWLAPALLVQEEALSRGTRRLAVLPVGIERDQRESLPDEFALELSDALEFGPWARPPLFVQVLDAPRTRNAWRVHGTGRRVLSPYQAAQIGRELGADLVMAAAVDSVARGEAEVVRTRRPARTRAGADTAFTVVEGRDQIHVRVRWSLVDPDGMVLERGEVHARTGARFRRAEYRGDAAELELSRPDRELLDRGNRRGGTDRELSRELVEELVPALARDVFSRLELRIP